MTLHGDTLIYCEHHFLGDSLQDRTPHVWDFGGSLRKGDRALGTSHMVSEDRLHDSLLNMGPDSHCGCHSRASRRPPSLLAGCHRLHSSDLSSALQRSREMRNLCCSSTACFSACLLLLRKALAFQQWESFLLTQSEFLSGDG